jgi:MFS family permease
MSQVQSLPVWSIASPLAGGALHAAGSGLFHTLLPLRLVSAGEGASIVGLAVMAESAGFLVGCVGSTRLIRSVGEVRAYAAFSALAAVLLLSIAFNPGIAALMAVMAVMGFVNAGQTVIIESWLNAMVPNSGRGRALTLYVLVIGLFYGLGQLVARDIDPAGNDMLMFSAAFYVLALVPVTAIWVGEPQLHAPVGIHILRAFRTSPLGAFACLLTGLVSSTFANIGSLYVLDLGFTQDRIALLMSAVVLGALFLQFPLGALSDKLDRTNMMLTLAVVLVVVCGLFFTISVATPFWMLLVLFSAFGGISEIFYPLGVAHANDRAEPADFVPLSSNLLLIWAFGGTVGPLIGATGIERYGANAFFWYAGALSIAFAVFALWRRLRRTSVKRRKDFVTYPQTSPEVYQWLPAADNQTPEKNEKP